MSVWPPQCHVQVNAQPQTGAQSLLFDAIHQLSVAMAQHWLRLKAQDTKEIIAAFQEHLWFTSSVSISWVPAPFKCALS